MRQWIDLRSDTLTRPTDGMRRAMAMAEMGDDCFGEDRTVIRLEQRCATLFDKEAAVFLPTGTMSNQIAVRVLVDPGNEILCDADHHLHFFESAPTAVLGGVTINAVSSGDIGLLDVPQLEAAIDARARWAATYAKPGLLWQENTVNGRGGKVVPLQHLQRLQEWATSRGLPVYIDGARILNACVATQHKPVDFGRTCTALATCFAKGLGAPMGSVLVGTQEFVKEARRLRKWYGGALHQAGVIAAAALYGLEHHVERLHLDHANASAFAAALCRTGLVDVTTPETNIVIFDIRRLDVDPDEFVRLAYAAGVKLLKWRAAEIRAVFSMEVSSCEALEAAPRICSLIDQFRISAAERVALTARTLVCP